MTMVKYRIFTAITLGAGLLAACADTDILPYTVEKPQDLTDYEYLDSYADLKTYLDRSAHPGFLLGTGVLASDYNSKGVIYRLTNHNFDIITAGNAMKYASVVDDKGDMNFSTVTAFVENARSAGVQVYGHTLCWHEQQNAKWLNSLIKDKDVEVDPGDMIETEDATVTYDGVTEFPYFVMGYKPDMVDGVLTVKEYPGEWYQFFVMDGLQFVEGREYTVTARIRGSKPGDLNVQLGDWGALQEKRMSFTDEWSEVSIKMPPVTTAGGFSVFQPGTYDGSLEIDWIRLSHSEANIAKTKVPIETFDFSDDHKLRGWGSDITYDVIDGVFVINNSTAAKDWEKQVCYETETPLEVDQTYLIDMRVRGSKKGSVNLLFQNPDGYVDCGSLGSMAIDTDWNDITVKGTVNGDGAKRILFNVGNYDGKIEIASMMIYYEKSANVIQLTPEQKAEILEAEMERWVSGMMAATQGYVKAWDVVNEPISGGPWGQRYDLQHAVNDPDAAKKFYWQDYLGDDFVRVPVKYARKYFEENGGNPDDLKLFINDYNLESDWDDNQKLKSLISWIEQWESDGVTRIDGIGSQMHISYYLNPQTQQSKADHIEKMFRLMAASGKLVRITELDMGLVDENGNDIPTAQVTLEQHKLMADYYKWIIRKYFEIIPVEQQFGITLWCQTDSPEGSGWRPNQPTGIWNAALNRKPAYAGIAEGLAGQD